MISVIICSADKTLLLQVTENIAATIGVPHEIIAIDNSQAKQGICSVYNQGIDKAQFELLCFMHEDVLINTANWGKAVIESFNQNTNLGLLGVIGSSYKSMTPSGWGSLGFDTYYSNLIQHNKHSNKPTKHIFRNPHNEKLVRVACVDGVWLCASKKALSTYKFDEVNFTGFHAYDLDLCLGIGQQYQVAVTYDVLIEHFSEGSFDQKWMLDNIKLHKKWNSVLPLNYAALNNKQIVQSEKATFKHFIKQLSSLKLPLIHAYKMLEFNNRYRRLSIKLYYKLWYYLMLRCLRISKVKH